MTKSVRQWVALAVAVAFLGAGVPAREADAAEPFTTAGVIVGSTLGAGLPAGLTGLGTGTGVYAFVFTGSVTATAIVAGVAVVAAAALVGGYFYYKHLEKKRIEREIAASVPREGVNVARNAPTVPRVTASTGDSPAAPPVGAAPAGIPRE